MLPSACALSTAAILLAALGIWPLDAERRQKSGSSCQELLTDSFWPRTIKSALPEAIFDGMEYQRLRLHHDQQVPEWE